MKRIMTVGLMLLVLLAAMTGQAEDYTWSEGDSTRITFAGTSVTVEGDGAVADGTIVTISEAGAYILSGTLDDGQVRIAATKDDSVRLVLNGVSLSSNTTAPIYASKADTLTIILADSTENTVSDAVEYVYADGEDEPDAAIFSNVDLAIGGSGALTVTGHYRNGIGTKDDLLIEGGVINVTAANDGLRGRDSITVTDGSITVDAANDGIKSNNDEDAEKGWVAIKGGALDIASAHDGIQAETSLTVTGGTISIIAGGGAANAPERAAEERFMGGPGRQEQTPAATDTTTAEDAESDSMKGMKAGASLLVEDGTITIDSADDALHTNGSMTLNGGTLTLTTGDDGTHADADLVVGGGSITVTQSYEGLEGATITMTGGDVSINASDDGINAAGGTDSAGGWDTFRMGGSSDYWIDISGGSLLIDVTGGDGIDSNGAITVSGGAIMVNGSASGGESAIDADGAITINGGTIATVGGAGQGSTPASASEQVNLIVYYSGSQQAGTVELLDESGAVLATISATKAYQLVQFSLPALEEGETYTVRNSNGMETEIEVTATIMTVGEDGAAVSGMGGFGGGRGGFGGQGGHEGRMRPEGMTQPDGMPRPGEAPPEGGAIPPDGATPPQPQG